MSEFDPLVQKTYQRFAESDFGRFQSTQCLRYAKKYGYGEREEMLADLGDDIDPLRHMLHTHDEVLLPLIKNKLPHELSDSGESIIRSAALLHDIGECEHPNVISGTGHSVGDVLYHEKNGQHELSEAKIRSWFYESLYPDLPEDFLLQVDEVISNNEANELSHSFNMAERLGYYETAIRAGRVALSSELTSGNAERTCQLARLSVGVSATHIPVLDKSSSDYEYIEKRLEETSAVYQRIHSELICIV